MICPICKRDIPVDSACYCSQLFKSQNKITSGKKLFMDWWNNVKDIPAIYKYEHAEAAWREAFKVCIAVVSEEETKRHNAVGDPRLPEVKTPIADKLKGMLI